MDRVRLRFRRHCVSIDQPGSKRCDLVVDLDKRKTVKQVKAIRSRGRITVTSLVKRKLRSYQLKRMTFIRPPIAGLLLKPSNGDITAWPRGSVADD